MTTQPSHVNPLLGLSVPQPLGRPSQAQLDEIATVRGLQVRTEAVKLAIALVQGTAYAGGDVLDEAKAIAAFIETGNVPAPS